MALVESISNLLLGYGAAFATLILTFGAHGLHVSLA